MCHCGPEHARTRWGCYPAGTGLPKSSSGWQPLPQGLLCITHIRMGHCNSVLKPVLLRTSNDASVVGGLSNAASPFDSRVSAILSSTGGPTVIACPHPLDLSLSSRTASSLQHYQRLSPSKASKTQSRSERLSASKLLKTLKLQLGAEACKQTVSDEQQISLSVLDVSQKVRACKCR